MRVPLVVERSYPNDGGCVLARWLRAHGAAVALGELVAELETSKAVVEVHAPHGGVLMHEAAEGQRLPIGGHLGWIVEGLGADQGRGALPQPPASVASSRLAEEPQGQAGSLAQAEAPSPLITQGARELMQQHGVSSDELATLQLAVVRRADIERLLTARGAAPPQELASASGERPTVDGVAVSPLQAAVAATVVRSHATIPAAFLAIRLDYDPLAAALERFWQRTGLRAGLMEALIKAAGLVAHRFPACYRRDGAPVLGSDDPGVGLALDDGEGVVIPSIPCAASRSFASIVEQVASLRSRLPGHRLSPAELRGADITVALLHDADVLLSVPLVVPGQTAIVSAGGVQSDLALDGEDAVVVRRYVHLGLAYDHRFVNGREALAYLRALKAWLEGPCLEMLS